MSEQKPYPIEATILHGAMQAVVAAAGVPDGRQGTLIAIPLIFDPARVKDEAYIQELRDAAAKTFTRCLTGLGFELMKAAGVDTSLTCEDCCAIGEFGRTWPVDFLVGAKVVCQRCMEEFIRQEGRMLVPGSTPFAPAGRRMVWFKPTEAAA